MHLATPSMRSTLRRLARPLTLLALVVVGALVLQTGSRAASRHATAAHAGMAMPGMSMPMDWFDTHPRVGRMAATVIPPAATFTVSDFLFNADGNAATVNDTVHILTGQVVQWNWVTGIHTVTDGVDENDPNAGFVIDQPLNTLSKTFAFQFTSAGTFPFFCRYHGTLYNMKGVVVVTAPVPTARTSWGTVKKRYAH